MKKSNILLVPPWFWLFVSAAHYEYWDFNQTQYLIWWNIPEALPNMILQFVGFYLLTISKVIIQPFFFTWIFFVILSWFSLDLLLKMDTNTEFYQVSLISLTRAFLHCSVIWTLNPYASETDYLLNLGVSKMLLPIARNTYLSHPHPYIMFLLSLKPWRNIFSLLRWMIQPKNLMLVNIMTDILGFLTQFPIYLILLKWVDLGTWEILVVCNRRACNAPPRSSKFLRSSPSSIFRIPCQYTIYSILNSI